MTSDTEDRIFRYGMYWRIFYGSLRILFGIVLFRLVGTSLIDIITRLMTHELVQDPSDKLYAFAVYWLGHHPLSITYFLASYFIFWGVVDIVLSVELLRERLWAFPASLVLIAGFVIYEIIRFTHTHSLILLWIIFVDIFIFWFIEREYKKLKSKILPTP
jgi:uncharacterized membrane protein